MKKFFTLIAATMTALTMNATVISVAEAIQIGLTLDSAAVSETEYTVEGYVINALPFSLSYMNQSFYMADAADAAESDFQAYACVAVEGNDTLRVINGDKVQLTGNFYKYWDRKNSKFVIEVRNGSATFVTKTEGDHTIDKTVEEITVARALEIGAALEFGSQTDKQYEITGYVTALAGRDTDFGNYGNQTYWIADDQNSTAASNADGAFEVYRGIASEEVAEGYKVKVKTVIKKYNDGTTDGLIESESRVAVTILEKVEEEKIDYPEGVISCDSAVALTKALADPTADNKTVEGQQVKVWGYVTYAYAASEKDGVVKQSAWLADSKRAKNGKVQGAYLQIASMDAAVEKGDLVEIEGTLAKYYKAADNIIVEVINGTMRSTDFIINVQANPTYAGSVNIADSIITAIPNYGYHFEQWNDGITTNPRLIHLTQDTTFTAEFAKNTYTITTAPSTPEWGTTAGDTTALYLDEVEISATPNYGYHFVRWSDNNTQNPRTYTITADATLTAIFAKNIYNITKNAEHGTISGNSSAEYLDFVTLTVTPDYGYHFTQWSDGLKDNPRIFQITSDSTFTAEFAYDRVGTCGKDLALVWSYDQTNKVLTIGNAGSFTENMQFGVEAPTEMEELVIGNSVTAIGSNAFAGISTLKKVTIGESVKTIYDRAFYNCENLETIFNFRPTPTNAYSTAFDGVDKFECVLYVLPNSIDMYKAAAVWRDFYYTYAIGAEETTVTTNDVQVEPQDNAATFTWPTNDNAATYTIAITKDNEVVCRLIFNADGQLTGIAFAPSRNGTPRQAPAAQKVENGGLQFTVTGLNSNTNYSYSVVAKDAQEEVVASYEGDFATTGDTPTSIGDASSENRPCTKILRNGQILILRGEKVYTLQGQEVR